MIKPISPVPTTAFVLGAGLGARLRPLTNHLPKPLIRVFQKPLITFAFDHLVATGVRNFIVNTHHLPGGFEAEFPYGIYRGAPLTFRHEPVLLETGGGIKNIQDLIPAPAALLIYNGDILTDLPVAKLAEAHIASGADVTLALRSGGGPLRVAFEEVTGRVPAFAPVPAGTPGRVFTGVYIVGPALFDFLEAGKAESVIGAFRRMIADGRRVMGVTIDEGRWFDLGTREALLDAHRELIADARFPAYAAASPWRERLHRGARIEPGAVVDEASVLGPGVVIESGARIAQSIIYAGARVGSGCTVERSVVSPGEMVRGNVTGQIV